MLLYIIRHGIPDYATNTLLPEGAAQAELCARRLSKREFKAIYSSPYGRAIETARPLAEKLGLPVQIEEWAYELGEESKTEYPDGVRKLVSNVKGTYYHQERFLGLTVEEAFEKVEAFPPSFKERYESISRGLDDLLKRHGYARNKAGTYDVTEGNRDRIALFCHGGMERVLLSHMFHIPYPIVAHSIQVPTTGITIVYFPEEPEEEGAAMPVLYTLGDIGHLTDEAELCRHYVSKEVL